VELLEDMGRLLTTMERYRKTTDNYGETAVYYGYYLKGGLVYLTMPTISTTEGYGVKIFFPDARNQTKRTRSICMIFTT
jgi:hypothetical protein